MIYTFSTLGESADANHFYRIVDAAVDPLPVCLALMGDAFAERSPSRLEIDWALDAVPDVGGHTPPIDLDVWVERLAGSTKRRRLTARHKIDRYARFIDHKFRQTPPSLVLVSSNSVPHTGIPFELARAIQVPVAAFERGYLPLTFQVSDYGSGPFSQWSDRGLSDLVSHHQAAEFERQGELERDRLSRSKGRRPPADADDDPTGQTSKRSDRVRTLFLPVADVSFSVYPLKHPDHMRIMPAFRDSLHVARSLHRSSAIELVVKPHPTESGAKKWRPSFFHRIHVAHGDPIEWIRWADVVVCNGSTLDLVAVAMGKPLVLAGRSILSGKGIAAAEIRRSDELVAAVRDAAEFRSDDDHRRRFRQFLGWLRNVHLLDPADPPETVLDRFLQQLRLSGVDTSRLG